MKQFVLYSKEVGVYLGNFWGLGFWSELDSVGQTAAITFQSCEEAMKHASTWESSPVNISAVEVECSDSVYATINECSAAGLPKWTP